MHQILGTRNPTPNPLMAEGEAQLRTCDLNTLKFHSLGSFHVSFTKHSTIFLSRFVSTCPPRKLKELGSNDNILFSFVTDAAVIS
jgi:hypothetical protein